MLSDTVSTWDHEEQVWEPLGSGPALVALRSLLRRLLDVGSSAASIQVERGDGGGDFPSAGRRRRQSRR